MGAEDSLPRLLSGRYQLERVLGQGGMGVVYGGTDLLLKRAVAVKLIRGADGEQLDDEVAGRFLREAKNTARLHHEHIIELFDLGRSEEGSLYFVMELLVGESLSARLRRQKQISVDSAVHIGVQICAALHVAHASGVVHRDLKPANIMLVSRAGDDEFVKVLDFGVAKSISGDQQTQLTHTGMLVGTIDYMAPEQIMGKPVDARTDIYSFGILLYRLLSGSLPFKDNGVPSLVNAHLNTVPPRVSSVVRGIPSALDRVILRCLAKAPRDRFASMAELADALAATVRATTGAQAILDDDDDPYEKDFRTVVVPPKTPPVGIRTTPALPPASDTTLTDDIAPSFDETTIRIGAKPSARPPSLGAQRASRLPPPQPPRARREAPAFGEDDDDEETRALLGRSSPGKCAMCHTVNPTYARVCGSCGISLASGEQLAVRERVHSAPPPVPSFTPPAPLPGSDDFMGEANEARLHRRPPAAPGTPEAPRSLWQRLFGWTGRRG